MQWEVVRACEKLGYTWSNQINIKGFDILISEKKLVIKFKGPIHYLNNYKILMESSLYKYKLVQDRFQYKEIFKNKKLLEFKAKMY